jgi:hypothetical protein
MSFLAVLFDFIKNFGFMILTFLLGLGWTAFRKRRRLGRLRRAFGEDADSVENVCLCVPLLGLKAATRETCRFEKKDFTGEVHSFHGPSEALAYQDVEAGREVASIFNDFFSDPIEMIYDNTTKDLTGKTVFFIGAPVSNFLVKHVLRSVEQPFVEFVPQEETEEHQAALGFKDLRTNEVLDSGGEREYSLVMRLPNPHSDGDHFFFLCGAHAAGTFAAARYLKQHWREFVGAEEAAVVFLGMVRGCCHTASPVRKYGFKD